MSFSLLSTESEDIFFQLAEFELLANTFHLAHDELIASPNHVVYMDDHHPSQLSMTIQKGVGGWFVRDAFPP